MLLIGVNRSPYTRRVAITLRAYGLSYEQQNSSGFGNRDEVRVHNPLGRIPVLVLDSGEALVDSSAIIDHLDEVHGGRAALTPATGPERRAVLRTTAWLLGACDKMLQAAYERNHRPPAMVYQPWIEDCMAQAGRALDAVEATLDADARHVLFGRLTQADVTGFVAERLARGVGLDTAARVPRLHALARRLAQTPPFASTEP